MTATSKMPRCDLPLGSQWQRGTKAYWCLPIFFLRSAVEGSIGTASERRYSEKKLTYKETHAATDWRASPLPSWRSADKGGVRESGEGCHWQVRSRKRRQNCKGPVVLDSLTIPRTCTYASVRVPDIGMNDTAVDGQ
ncbi:hypothetical protein FRB94_006145 [Tulasnella sp. JGI-2019a]|nr:hypothetical protein FRB94_006145 [Tulasnella sp. JGI-2019a]KAG9016544.1 hypothetical protein FRB93_010794 [Tulasnella sp. JGI-2019a]